MRVYRLGQVSWQDSQLVYHTLPRMGREGLVICWPASPYLCLGYNSPVAEVDPGELPLFRREVGGGLVYLDHHQVFYQVVVRPDSPLARGGREAMYRRLLVPVRAALAEFGLEAAVRPPCDLWVGGRKISGNGAGEIAGHYVFVGNLLLAFPVARMCRALAASEEFREAAQGAMEENLTTLERELGEMPAQETVAAALEKAFGEAFGTLEIAEDLDDTFYREKERVARRLCDPAWLQGGRRAPEKRVLKICEGIYLRETEQNQVILEGKEGSECG